MSGQVPPQLAKFVFQKGRSGNPAGRRRDRTAEALRELLGVKGRLEPVTAVEVGRFCALLFSLSTEAVQSLAVNPKTPLGLRSLVEGMLADLAHGKIYTVKELMDRAYGPADAKRELTVRQAYDPDAGRSPEELLANLERMVEAAKSRAKGAEGADG